MKGEGVRGLIQLGDLEVCLSLIETAVIEHVGLIYEGLNWNKLCVRV